MTVLTDIEAMINSRPLTYIGDDIREGRVITPALSAIGRDLGNTPDDVPKPVKLKLSDRYLYQQRLQNHFWSRWLQEYFSTERDDPTKVDKGRNPSQGKGSCVDLRRQHFQRKMETRKSC